MSKSLSYRQDSRSEAVFADNIKDFTKREQIWMTIYVADLIESGHEVKLYDNGVDNSGGLIKSNLTDFNADNRIDVDGQSYLIEVKTIPEWSVTYTFKEFLLHQYVKQGAYILVPRLNEYYLFGTYAIKDMLVSFEPKIYHGFCKNKKAIRFGQKELNIYVEHGSVFKGAWSEPARKLIAKSKDVLFKTKTT